MAEVEPNPLISDPFSTRFESVQQFLNWHEHQPGRYELVGGKPMMQAGANRRHERIAKNIIRELEGQIDLNRFDVNKSDFAVNIGVGDDGQLIVRYPNVVVDEPTGNDKDRIANNPVLVVEVLSRSTQKVDTEVKPQEYGAIRSIETYIVYDCDNPIAQVWQRDRLGNWPGSPVCVRSGEVTIPGLDARLKMDAVYASVSFKQF